MKSLDTLAQIDELSRAKNRSFPTEKNVIRNDLAYFTPKLVLIKNTFP